MKNGVDLKIFESRYVRPTMAIRLRARASTATRAKIANTWVSVFVWMAFALVNSNQNHLLMWSLGLSYRLFPRGTEWFPVQPKVRYGFYWFVLLNRTGRNSSLNFELGLQTTVWSPFVAPCYRISFPWFNRNVSRHRADIWNCDYILGHRGDRLPRLLLHVHSKTQRFYDVCCVDEWSIWSHAVEPSLS